MTRVSKRLRDYVESGEPLDADALLKIADEIDLDHGNRMQQRAHETRRYVLHRVRSMMNDMERGIKWARKR